MIETATIDGSPRASPSSVPATEVMALLAEHGAVVFRGFDCDSGEFVRLTRQYSDRFTSDPMKVRGGRWQTAQGLVGRLARAAAHFAGRLPRSLRVRPKDDGTRAAPFKGYGLNPHNENAFLPGGCPDLIWFYCKRPADDGGRSILCDGAEILSDLSTEAVRFLREIPVRFEMSYDRDQWRAAYGIDDEAQLRALLEPRDDVTFEVTPSGTLEYTYDAVQIEPTRLGGTPAVNTNLLSRRPYGEVGSEERERTAGGEPYPPWVIEELLRAVAGTRAFVDLRSHEVAMIDNSRVLHGREPFTDTSRRLLARLSWLKPALVNGAAGLGAGT